MLNVECSKNKTFANENLCKSQMYKKKFLYFILYSLFHKRKILFFHIFKISTKYFSISISSLERWQAWPMKIKICFIQNSSRKELETEFVLKAFAICFCKSSFRMLLFISIQIKNYSMRKWTSADFIKEIKNKKKRNFCQYNVDKTIVLRMYRENFIICSCKAEDNL